MGNSDHSTVYMRVGGDDGESTGNSKLTSPGENQPTRDTLACCQHIIHRSGTGRSLYEKTSNPKLSGNEVYYTNY